MKSQWQQFQQQQRQQQQRMQQAAWMEQQKSQQQAAGQQVGFQPDKEVDLRFSQAEQEAARLRQKFAAGRLSQEELEARLQELMVQDVSGVWWMVGTESGRWYRYDGANWKPGTPPARGVGGAPVAARVSQTVSTGGSLIKAFLVFGLGVAISVGLFWFCGWASYQIITLIDSDLANPASFFIAGLAGLIGLIVTWRKARRVARGY